MVSNHDHKFQNIFVHSWEADHFSVTGTGYTWEIEVKVSRSDFFADFKKPKHHFFKGHKKGYGILIEDHTWRIEGWPIVDKFPELKGFKIEYTSFKSVPVNGNTCPNKFWYACPVGLIDVSEVPTYAGLIYVMDSGEARVIKKAPFMHKEIMNVKEMLFSKYMYLVFDLKERVRNLESELKYLKEKTVV
jgi:hypothetical protein